MLALSNVFNFDVLSGSKKFMRVSKGSLINVTSISFCHIFLLSNDLLEYLVWHTNQKIYNIYLLCLPHQGDWEGFQKLLKLIQHFFNIFVSLLVVDHSVHFHYHSVHFFFLTVPSPEFWQEIDFVDALLLPIADCSYIWSLNSRKVADPNIYLWF